MDIYTTKGLRGRRILRFTKQLWGKPAYSGTHGSQIELVADGQDYVRYTIRLDENDLKVINDAYQEYKANGTWR